MNLPAIGYLQVHAFTSYAQLPIKDPAVTVTDTNGTPIAMRLTSRSGTFPAPLEIEVPNKNASTSPNTGVIPFALVNLQARKENYEEIFVTNIQIFANTITDQPLQLIPLAEFPGAWNKAENFNTPSQNL